MMWAHGVGHILRRGPVVCAGPMGARPWAQRRLWGDAPIGPQGSFKCKRDCSPFPKWEVTPHAQAEVDNFALSRYIFDRFTVRPGENVEANE